MNETQAILAIAIMAAVTVGLRFAPFILLKGKKIPAVILRLGSAMPCALMTMLVVYCLKGVSFTDVAGWVPQTVAALVTAGAYLWRKNTLFGIVCGTVCCMILTRVIA